jgi:spore coat protein CotF
MKWVEALKIWNADHKDVNTKSVYAVPRKDTKDMKDVKEVMENGGIVKKRRVVLKKKEVKDEKIYDDFTKNEVKDSVKKVVEMRAEPMNPKDIVGEKVVKKTLANPPSNDSVSAFQLQMAKDKEKKLYELNEYIMYKNKWNKLSDASKDGQLAIYQEINRLPEKIAVFAEVKRQLLPLSKHITDYIEETGYRM